VDHSVRWSMKNAASCVKRCEMQDTPSTWFSNAYCSLGSFPGLRLSEGLYEIKLIVKVCVEYTDILMLYSRQTYASPDQTHDRRLRWCMLSFNSLATTAEHHMFCWPLSHSSDAYKTCIRPVSCVVSTGDSWRILLAIYCLTFFSMSTSDQARLPAKFKHIIKRWKRNQKGYP
jgi:hypothetical protein